MSLARAAAVNRFAVVAERCAAGVARADRAAASVTGVFVDVINEFKRAVFMEFKRAVFMRAVCLAAFGNAIVPFHAAALDRAIVAVLADRLLAAIAAVMRAGAAFAVLAKARHA